ncbi:MAG: alpha/beta fold hydrolase, partial [Pseudomonadota bacterium]
MAFLSLAFVIAAIVAYGEIYAFRASGAYTADGRFIDWRSKRLHVRDLGRASKPPVLLIHGSSANGREFLQNLVPALDQDFRLLVPDRPGAGHSERPFNAARLSQQAAAMAQVLDDAGGAPAIVVGHSFGAPVGLRLAMDRPDLVKGLVLLAPVSHPWDGKTRLHNRLAANPIYGRLFARIVPFVGPAAATDGMQNVFGPQTPPDGYAEATGLSLLFRPATFRANAQDLASINAELAAQASRYPEIDIPTVIFS